MISQLFEDTNLFWKRQTSSTADTPQNRQRDEEKGGIDEAVAQQFHPFNSTDSSTGMSDPTTNQEVQKLGSRNMKAIVIAALVVVTVLLLIFILYLIWRIYKRKQRKAKKRKQLEDEAREAEPNTALIRSPPPVLTVRIESDSNISRTTMNSSHAPSTPTLLENSPITKPGSMRSPFNESSSASSFRTTRNAVHSRPSGLSLNTTASMLIGSERHDSCSSPMTSPNYDENAYRLSRALQSSPVVSALLSESFDTQAVRKNGKQKEGERSFDWTQCEFEKEEEAAMWLPDLKRDFSQISHNRTISEPTQIGIAADRRHAIITHEITFADCNGILSPISSTYTDLSRQPSLLQTNETTHNVELLVSQPNHPVKSPSLVIVPFTPRSAALSRHETNRDSKPSHSRNFVVMSRQRPSSAGVVPTPFESVKPKHLRTVSSAISDSECSTESLRRAGALAIRNSNSSLKMTDSSSLSSPISTESRHKDSQYPPSASRSATTWSNKRLKKPSSSGSGSGGQNDTIELIHLGYGFEAVAT